MGEIGRKTGRLLVLFLVVAAATGVGLAQNRSTVSGFVFGTDRRPVSQVIVELRSEYNSVVGRMRTDGSGRFFFTGVGHGRFSIRALPFGTGYTETSVDIEITGTGMRGQALADNVQKDVYLRERKNAGSSPFVNVVVYAQTVPREAEVAYKDAISELDRDKADTGAASLEKALEIFPEYFAALQRLGSLKLVQNKFADAAVIFERALAVNDRSFDCWYGLAYSRYALKKFKESAEAAEKSVLIKSDSMEGNLLLGMDYRMLKNYPEAEKSLRKAEKLAEGTSSDVHWQLALLYGKEMNKFGEAAKQLENYLILSPDAPNKEDVKKLIKQFKDKAKSAE